MPDNMPDNFKHEGGDFYCIDETPLPDGNCYQGYIDRGINAPHLVELRHISPMGARLDGGREETVTTVQYDAATLQEAVDRAVKLISNWSDTDPS